MESRVNPILKLAKAGQEVSGAGPIDSWEPSELGAIVTVVIVQPQPAAGGPAGGGITLAVAGGSTGWINKTATAWGATVEVVGTQPLKPGPAVAFAHGLIEYAPGVLETYDWTVHVVLEP